MFVFNKADIATEEQKTKSKSLVKLVNPITRFTDAEHGQVEVSKILKMVLAKIKQ